MRFGEVIRNKLHMDHTFMEHSYVQISDINELWNTCTRTTYFQSKLKFFKAEGMVVGSSFSSFVKYIYGPVLKISLDSVE
jgi:hypothetical protein